VPKPVMRIATIILVFAQDIVPGRLEGPDLGNFIRNKNLKKNAENLIEFHTYWKNMQTSLSLEKVNNNEYNVIHENGTQIGEFLKKEDGYFDFWPKLGGGYWRSCILRDLANHLDALNKEWDDEIANYFNEQKEVEEKND